MSPEEKPPKDSESNSRSGSFEDLPEVAEQSSESTPAVVPSASGQSESEPEDSARFDGSSDREAVAHEPIVADIAGGPSHASPGGEDAVINPAGFAIQAAPPIAANLENMSANGGAIGSLVLGVWCVIGSFVTNWSIINGVMGLLLGFWGLTSRKRRTAWIGIALCLLGMLMSAIQVSELINSYLNAVDETPY